MNKRNGFRDYFNLGIPVIILVVVGFILAYQFVGPAPPKTIRIATGRKDGAYFAFAQQYVAVLAKEGIVLDIVETEGSIENMKLLDQENSNVDVALIQSGTFDGLVDPSLIGLGSLYLEPLWIFHRAEISVGNALSNLKGKRVAVGAVGSGTRSLAIRLLNKNGVSDTNSTFIDVSGSDAASALLKSKVDAVFLVSSPDSKVVERLVRDSSISLFSCVRADAYVRRFSFLSKVTLPTGVLDFERSLPAEDVVLLAPAATFVARKKLHPALIDLLLQAANDVHGRAGLLSEKDQFPSPLYCDLPLSKDADRYFKYGPPFLQRYLPFWLATLVDRLKIMMLPMIILLLPMFKIVPPVFQWRTRRKVVKWYSRLQEIDLKSQSDMDADERKALADEIKQIDHDVSHVSIPLGYADQLYSLRLHIELVSQNIRDRDAYLRNGKDHC